MDRRPYGSWTSPIRSARIARGSLRLSQPRLDRGALYWLEGRPDEGGRQLVVRATGGRPPAEVTPPAANVRSAVHEYGGGEYCVRDGVVYYSDFRDHRVYRVSAEAGAAEAMSAPGARYADLAVSPDGRWLVAVEERPREEREPENRLVALPLAGGGAAHVVAAGSDFVSSPSFSPDGTELAYLTWNHPDMPWDGTLLLAQAWGPEGPAGPPREIAGGPRESIFQPSYSPAGRLTFASDRSGWWNLYQQRESGAVALCPRAAEFGAPQWQFGMSRHAWIGDDALLCAFGRGGSTRLGLLDVQRGALRELDAPYRSIDGLRAEGGRACFVGAAPDRPAAVCSLDVASGAFEEHCSSFSLDFEPGFVSVPEAIEFETAGGGRAHAFLYAPAHPRCAGPAGERPPLRVGCHGGPTSAASSALDLRLQYWTSRGFAVADVDYRGSSGYGRAYRELLRGAWGVADVDDCVHAVRAAAARGLADAERAVISGGSAGGFTVLCALTFRDAFRAGASHYGIGDLEALARDTHKFEAHYLDGLVGAYPERRDLYRERSPIHSAGRLAVPVIFFQGLEDRVVPPSQAEAMVAALSARGIPHAYVAFAGEQHGFRRADSIRTALDGELYFYAQILGFEVEVRPEAARVAWGAARAGR